VNLKPQRRLVRIWAKMFRLMRSRRDRKGMSFAIERARIWREYVNRMERSQN